MRAAVAPGPRVTRGSGGWSASRAASASAAGRCRRQAGTAAAAIFNAGTAVGGAFAVPVVSFIALRWGWRWAFVGTGALGFAWVLGWALFYRLPQGTAPSGTGGHMGFFYHFLEPG